MPLNFPDLAPDHPANRLSPNALRENDHSFSAKLRFDERCSVMALQLAGVNAGQVALAYGINRRTATRMLQPGKYADVKRKLRDLGEKDFIATYVTEDALAKVQQFAASPLLDRNSAEDPVLKGERRGIPNRRGTSGQGITVYKPDGAPHSHRIDVQWGKFHEDAPEGWWAKLLDEGGMEDAWFGDADADSHITSASALRFAKKYLDEVYG